MKLFALILSAALASPLTKGRARRQDLETTDGDYVEYADYDADGNPADGGRGKICYRFLHGNFLTKIKVKKLEIKTTKINGITNRPLQQVTTTTRLQLTTIKLQQIITSSKRMFNQLRSQPG